MNKIFEYKNRGTRKGNIYYLIDDDTIEIEIENNNNEIQTLIQTRNGLLPKLMSGEIKV